MQSYGRVLYRDFPLSRFAASRAMFVNSVATGLRVRFFSVMMASGVIGFLFIDLFMAQASGDK